jgi:surfeit locus 1 family protein
MRRLIILLAALTGCLLTGGLGAWQLSRAQQKIALAASQERQAQAHPLGNAQLPGELHRRVRLTGRWLDERTVFLDNRPMGSRFGLFVVTPLKLEGRAEAILVQRGWLPRNFEDRSKLPDFDSPEGTVTVEGLLIDAPSRVFTLGLEDPGPIRQNLDPAAFAREIGEPLLPMTVQQTGPAEAAGSPGDGLLRDWPAPDLGLQKHYGYAFQWFALCALILGLYVWFQLLKRPEPRSS